MRLTHLLVGLLVCATSMAQRTPVWLSVETYTSNAETVCVGTVSKIEGGATDKDGGKGFTIIMQPTEMIKGTRQDSYKFFVYNEFQKEVLPYWTKTKDVPRLWFFGTPNGQDSVIEYFQHLPIDPLTVGTALPATGYFSMEYRLLRTPKEILSAVRSAAKSLPNKTKSHTIYDMPETIRRQFPYAMGGELLVPVCPALEKTALRMIKSPETFIPPFKVLFNITREQYDKVKPENEGTIRRMGVQALAHFKSDSNIAILKSMIDDPFEENLPGEHQVRSIRKYSRQTLQEWGVSF